MRVCLVSTIGYPTRVRLGGVPTATRNMAQALSEDGHQVHVISREVEGAPFHETDGPVQLYWAPLGNLHYYLSKAVPGLGIWPRILRVFEWGYAIRRLLLRIAAKDGLDLVIYPNVWVEGFLHPGGIPAIVRMDTPLCTVRRVPGCGNRPGWGSYEALEQRVVRAADLICCLSLSSVELVTREYRTPAVKVVVVPNPVDTRLFHPLSKPSARPLRVFHSGRLGDWQKGTHVLLRAMEQVVERVPEVELRLAGPGQPELRGVSPAVLSRVRFLGWLDAPSLAVEYGLADVTAVPSLNWEAFGFVCVESFACGTPVVASDLGGLSDLVTHGQTGLLVPPGDVKALGKALVELLSDPACRWQMGRQARAKAEACCSFPVVSRQLAEACSSLCGRGNGPLW